MLRMPTSTADTVAYACLPASCGALTVTCKGCSGRTCFFTDNPTATRRSRRSIGTQATPTARAGVILLVALPPRNTSAVTYTSWRSQSLVTGISTTVPGFTSTACTNSMRSLSTITRPLPACGGVSVAFSVSPAR